MRKLIIILIFTSLVAAQTPTLLVPAGPHGWMDPVYSADGKMLAFGRADRNEIRVLVFGEDSTRSVVRGDAITKRFAFAPGEARIVYRAHVYALPAAPERLVSTSIYLFDPVILTSDSTGDAFGPYLINNRLYYRRALSGPLLDLQGQPRIAEPSYLLENGRLTVTNGHVASYIVFVSLPTQNFVGAEISPNGKWLAAVSEVNTSAELSLIRMSDGKTTQYMNAFAPSWQAGGNVLVCISVPQDGTDHLCTIDVSDQKLRVRWSPLDMEIATPALSPDGSRAVFISQGAIFELQLP